MTEHNRWRHGMGQSANPQGFVLPLTAGLGLVVILLAITMLTRSHQNQVTASAEKATVRSLAAAETGITKYRSLINNNRAIATYCANSGPEAACSTGTTWSNVCSTSNPVLSEVGRIQAAAAVSDTDWHSEDSDPWQSLKGDPTKGEYKLVSYVYTADDDTQPNTSPGQGTLIIEGRVNQDPDGSSTSRTAVTRLSVTIPVVNESSSPPGLWLQAASTVSSGVIQLDTTVQDSDCNGNSIAQLEPLQNASFISQNKQTPGLTFPALPDQGSSPPTTGVAGSYSIAQIDGARTFPDTSVGETAVNGVLTYQVGVGASDSQSLNLSGGTSLTVGTGSETVVLYLDGGMTIAAGASISLAPGSKLIIYAHGNVTLESDATTDPIANSGAPDQVELYVYGAQSVAITGGTVAGMNQFLVAPASVVSMSGGAHMAGTLWAQELQLTGPVTFTQRTTDLTNTKIGRSPNNRIQPITAWEQQKLP